MTARLTRGRFLRVTAAAAALASSPAAGSATRKLSGTLRVIGIGVDQLDQIRKQAEKDLGFGVAFDVTGLGTVIETVLSDPARYDVLSGYHYLYSLLWPGGGLQPIDTRRINRWAQVSNLFKYGKVRPGDPRCSYGQGDAAFRCLYVDGSGRYPSSPLLLPGANTIVQWIDERTDKPHRGLPEPRHVDGVPGVFNADAIGYNARVLAKRPEGVSWAELVNARWRGRVALAGDHTIGFHDAALAAEAAGLMRFRDKGDMTRPEIDRLAKVLIGLKRRRHFRGFWEDYQRAIDLMASNEVVVESMWSTMVSQLQAKGFPVRYAAPPEGYRGWSGGLAISSAIKDPARLQAAYDYINWWHSGYAGAVVMRQGYYTAVQAPTRRFVDAAEWDFWIEGKPAARDLPDPYGDVAVRRGHVRDGGSFANRTCRYALWNTLQREHVYQGRRWQDFLSA